ncbi:MAG: protein-L-isoaspartate(D-aspartate) O-methyltransferase [Desulfobacterales bacterium]|nr:protein-L-isoaspartate(D-aspartate) O-methyltransferase [Desulfobacterales bacterium]
MSWDDVKYARRREEMVRRQIEARHITDPAVLAAMRKVPRHLFVSEALQHKAYEDYPLPIGEQQTISQPFIVAEMSQALDLGPNDRVLEIGTGSGYQAAILAEIAYRVYTIERLHPLYIQARRLFDQLQYHNIVTRYTDGTTGWREQSPFEAIIVTAGAPQAPQSLIDQLAIGGRMVIPVGDQYAQDLIKIIKDRRGVRQYSLGGCRFVKLIGEEGWGGG